MIHRFKVSVRFFSEKSKSEWTKLDNWGNDFENDSLGKYLLEIEEIGTVEKIDIKLRITKQMSSVNLIYLNLFTSAMAHFCITSFNWGLELSQV